MEFSQLLNQISSLEGAQRQDKARLAEKDAKFTTLSEELAEVRKHLTEKTESLRNEKEKSSQLEVANRNQEKVQKQLKNALKSSKDENGNLSSQLEKITDQSKTDSMEYLENLQQMNAKYRNLLGYLEKQSAHQMLKASMDKAANLEAQLADRCKEETKACQNETQNLDILKSENEDLQQRLNEAVEENGNLQKSLSQFEAYALELEAKSEEEKSIWQNLNCLNCGQKIEHLSWETDPSTEREGVADVEMHETNDEETQQTT